MAVRINHRDIIAFNFSYEHPDEGDEDESMIDPDIDDPLADDDELSDLFDTSDENDEARSVPDTSTEPPNFDHLFEDAPKKKVRKVK